MKIISPLLGAALCWAGLMAGGTSAAAQDAPSDDVCMAIVYGDDEAPECSEKEIVVIARLPEGDRYRIPEALRFSDNPENEAWAERVESLEMTGAFGTLSCSTVGAGGFTGCTQQLLRQAYGEKREGSNVRFSELISAARAERLSEIDAIAAEEQDRVEQIEREYTERLERERAGEIAGEEGALPDPNAP
ncbi:hypothetical protein [Pontixanthobacter sp.]|uniref:hypothetical protein n=1 Tax=Pontixanthobacter sp. TaxID=2792078 RepID=UPI003C7BFEC2